MKKILIADDKPEVVELIGVTLGSENYGIIDASDGKETLRKTEQKKPDLILLDIMMPKLDGFEVCQKLKKNPQTRNIPIIVLTAKVMKEDKESCLEAGCTDYISKPIVPTELIAKVNQYTANRPGRKQENFPAKVLDIETLLKNSGKDKNLAEETLKMFLEYLPPQLSKIRKSIRDGNPEELERFSHSLKGAAKSAGAHLIAELALSLEKMATSSNLDQAETTFSRLQREKERFQEASEKISTI